MTATGCGSTRCRCWDSSPTTSACWSASSPTACSTTLDCAAPASPRASSCVLDGLKATTLDLAESQWLDVVLEGGRYGALLRRSGSRMCPRPRANDVSPLLEGTSIRALTMASLFVIKTPLPIQPQGWASPELRGGRVRRVRVRWRARLWLPTCPFGVQDGGDPSDESRCCENLGGPGWLTRGLVFDPVRANTPGHPVTAGAHPRRTCPGECDVSDEVHTAVQVHRGGRRSRDRDGSGAGQRSSHR